MERVTEGGDLTSNTIMETTVQVVDAYNEEVKAFNQEIQKVNEERRQLGLDNLTAMLDAFVSNTDEQALRKTAVRFQQRWGFSSHEHKKPARHLPYDHPQLEKRRCYVDAVTAQNEVHERLVLNFDQVWTILFEPQPKIISKRPENAGKKADPLRDSKVRRDIRRQMQQRCGLPLTEPAFEPHLGCTKLASLGATAQLTPVESWRTLDL